MTTGADGARGGLVLVTGATGYVGGRLVSRLLESDYGVRVLVRDQARLQGRPWLDRVEVAEGDVTRPETLPAAMAGIGHAYYLIHSMSQGHGFEDKDRRAAAGFAAAARAAGVRRIVYLGGLGDPAQGLSPHLRSRQEAGEALREGGVPVSEFRAAVVVGSGSISFEMIRYLTERIPVLVCPRWVYTKTQPIGIDDVLAYLVAAPAVDESSGCIIEIGGADVLSYGDMMLGYARARGLRRWLLPVPALTPRLSSYWVHWVTPVPASIAQPLIEGLRSEVVVRDDLARRLFPDICPVGYDEAVRRALDGLESGEVDTVWCDSLATSAGDAAPVCLITDQGMTVERRERLVRAPAAAVFQAFSGLGGSRGWPALGWAWRLRGAIDRLAGGVGFRRGRRDPDDLRVGDVLDFWRVEAIEPGRLLRLRAEMKVPGSAWLEFEAAPAAGGTTRLLQTALFAPAGLLGHVYWYAMYPFHALIFGRMARRIGEEAEALASAGPAAEGAKTPPGERVRSS